MTINLSLILQTKRIQKQFPLSVFVFIDCLAASVLQDAGGYAISRQNKLELHLDCHTCWLSYFTLVCLWCARTVSRAVGVRPRDYQIFSDGQITTFSYSWCSAARASRARAPLKTTKTNSEKLIGKQVFKNDSCNPFQYFSSLSIHASFLYLLCYTYRLIMF